MMKFATALVLAVCVGLAVGETYSTENDDFDIEALVKNPEEFQKFSGCFLDKNECDAVSGDFKKDIPEAFEQACAKCTDAQKHLFNRFLSALKDKRPQDFEDFKKKYDPEAKYYAALEKAVAKA
uniref:Chemosensory protein n=1 Tax=Cnaphalocrocis medinalis TaxID=437488 RepID=A0A0A1CP47_CNAME|nr:chemosensory protein [Cnaphalocrocis medinalis]